MNLALTPEQSQFKDMADRFIADHCAERGQQDSIFSRAIWQEVKELGGVGAGLLEMENGFGGGAVETMLIMEAAGRGLMRAPFLPVMVHAVRLLLAAGQGADKVDGIVAGHN